MLSRWAAVLATALCLPAVAQEPGWRVIPPDPTAGEDFVILAGGTTGSSPAFVDSSRVDALGDLLTLRAFVSTAGFSVNGNYRASGVTRVATAGNYSIAFQPTVNSSPSSARALGSIAIAAAQGPAAPSFRNLSGNWFATDEPGWGINIVQGDSGALFGVWLTFRPDNIGSGATTGNGLWLVMPSGRWLTPTRFRGVLYVLTGSPVTRPFNASDRTVVAVGAASLTFVSPTEADFEADAGYELFPDFSKRKRVTRFAF